MSYYGLQGLFWCHQLAGSFYYAKQGVDINLTVLIETSTRLPNKPPTLLIRITFRIPHKI